jgi:hypothetical protein
MHWMEEVECLDGCCCSSDGDNVSWLLSSQCFKSHVTLLANLRVTETHLHVNHRKILTMINAVASSSRLPASPPGRPLRVSQIDAEELDEGLVSMLSENVERSMRNFSVRFPAHLSLNRSLD